MSQSTPALSDAMKRSVKQFILSAKAMVKAEPVLNAVTGEIGERRVSCEIPQAGVTEHNLQAYEAKDWRRYFSRKLSGKGLEIGPLHRPMVRHEGMDIDYIDRFSVAELREHYPELKELPLVEPNIIGDAETMEGVPSGKYDFLISAHVIEHMRNPLGSLKQWCRTVKPGGLIYMIVPDKRATFDKKRVRTTLAHILLDYYRPSVERDYEHFLDYAIHVQGREAEAALIEAERLFETDYSIHFHVFLPSDVLRLLNWFSENIQPLEIVEGPVMSPGSDEFHFLLRVV